MKLRTLMTLGLLSLASLSAIACGDKKQDPGEGPAMGGAGSTEDQLSSLRQRVDDLEKALAQAAEEDVPALQEQLKEAQESLEALMSCQNGGSCEGVADVAVLTQVTDAYCEWVFGCCTDSEVRATVGAAAKDEAGCKEMYSSMLQRGNATPSLPGAGVFLDVNTLADTALRVQLGRIQLDEDAIAGCAALIAGQSCAGAPAMPFECGMESDHSCVEMFVGVQGLSEPCGALDECEAGLVCSGSIGGGADGVCLPEAVESDPCQNDLDCITGDGSLYCDESAGTCTLRPTEGETCKYLDPSFDTAAPTPEVPCGAGTWCSPDSNTCLAECDRLENGDLCTSHTQCAEASYCDFAALATQLYAGTCAPKLVDGAVATVASSCLSDYLVYYNSALRCGGREGFSCSSSTECRATCDLDAGTCRKSCDADSDCGADGVCLGDSCYPKVTQNSPCEESEQCPNSQYCSAGNCTNRKVEDAVCLSEAECEEAHVCLYDGVGSFRCRAHYGGDAGDFCSQWSHCASRRCDTSTNQCSALGVAADGACTLESLSAGVSNDPCQDGYFCKLSAPASNSLAGTCEPQLPAGSLCDRSQPLHSQCESNVSCLYNSTYGNYACPHAYTQPDESGSCILDVFSAPSGFGN